MYVEALNTGHDQLFGPALWGLISRTSLDSKDDYNEKESGVDKKHKFRWM